MEKNEAQQELFLAVAFSNVRGLEKAIVNGADPQCFFEDGRTPLTEAIAGGMGNPDVVAELIRLGADPSMKDKTGWSPWNSCISRLHDRVVQDEQEQIRQILIKNNASREGEENILLWQYSLNADIAKVKALLGKGVKPNSSLVCPLSAAVLSGNVELVALLLANGANVDGNYPKDHVHLTPFMHAAGDGELEIAKLLAENDADIHYEIYEEGDRRNAETYAKEGGHTEVASWIGSILKSK